MAGQAGDTDIATAWDFGPPQLQDSNDLTAESQGNKNGSGASYYDDLEGLDMGIEEDEGTSYFDAIFSPKSWPKRLRGIFLVSGIARIHRSVYRSKHGVFLERTRHISSFPWIIHPYSLFRWCWDIFMMIILIVTLVRDPLILTFYEDSLKEISHIWWSFIMGLVFFLDIFINFMTGYVSTNSDAVYLDPQVISWKYLKTWFVIDFVSSVPYDAIYGALVLHAGKDEEELTFMEYLRLLELLKLFRIIRVIRYLTKFLEAHHLNSLYIRVVNLYLVMMFNVHWMGCFHYLIPELIHHANDHTVLLNKSWVTEMELWEKPVADKYYSSILRALSNMVLLGYGNDVPKRLEDILTTILSIVVGASLFALFIGNICSILMNVDVSQKKYFESLNQVKEYMRFKQIPKQLQNRVHAYYEHRYRRHYFNEETILGSISDVLRDELKLYNCRKLVESVPLFTGLPSTYVKQIVSRLIFEVYLPQDVILNANTLGKSMFFIEHGTVAVILPTGKVATYLKDGDYFGEMALVTNEKRTASIVATTYCDVYRLNKDDFEESIHSYPKIYEQILLIVEERQKMLKQYGSNAKPQLTNEKEKKEFKENYFAYVKRQVREQKEAERKAAQVQKQEPEVKSSSKEKPTETNETPPL